MKEPLEKKIKSKLKSEQRKLKNYNRQELNNASKRREDLRSKPKLKKQNSRPQLPSKER